ncbi:murein hydrolase activator EnvC family protein [Dethiosulfovibrio salsuginis]|uniref:Septal ring factor EnvC, activator of murein hydrolases AmiA and AmiB n=1 Tax=Dethiosulfovibrio salsuginis TaxID=561720 RepID=A0A1X7K6E9_9BACT|nr:peptidoglycan DD-metalloendopeptidase family protein [Dethiosulfovibrio salsuginis]SMG36228.1 Septal ring factor EnvC, activator of murein hydrolases AmiA and AmiB [Dethiosulfovibrio salsuginis]
MIKRLPLLALFVLLSLFAGSSWAETPEDLDRKIKEEQRRMEILDRQARRQEELLKASKVREASYLQELSKFDQQRKAAEQSMSLLELQRRKVLGEISAMEKDIARLEKEIERIKAFLSERLVTIYKFGGTAELNLLLSSQNVSDAMNTGYLLKRLANQDEELIGSAERETAQVRTLIAGLAAREKDLQNKKRQMANQKKKLEQAVAERNGLLKKLRENQDAYRQSLKEAEQDQREIQAKIQAYIKAKEELARAKKPGTPEAPPLPKHGGKFQWPVRGRITSRFGTRVHPVFKTKTVHTGIDISAPNGTPVKAAGAGDVLYAGWLRGYGQIIILDNGGGYSTVYAHLSRIIATEGQRVAAGQHIGNVGDTGVTTGAHLHFEVRVKGDAKDPLKYLGR